VSSNSRRTFYPRFLSITFSARLESKTLDALKAFKYAVKHGYRELYDKAAEIMVADHYREKFMVLALDEGSPFAEALICVALNSSSMKFS